MEIGSYLNVLIDLASLSLGKSKSDENSELIMLFNTYAEASLHLVSDILDLNGEDQDDTQSDSLGFSLHDCLGNTLQTLTFYAERKSIRLNYRIMPGVPKSIAGNESLLRQIIFNLLSELIQKIRDCDVMLLIEKINSKNHGVLLHFSVSSKQTDNHYDNQKTMKKVFMNTESVNYPINNEIMINVSKAVKLIGMLGGKLWIEIPNCISDGEMGLHDCSFHFSVSLTIPCQELNTPLDLNRFLHSVNGDRNMLKALGDVIIENLPIQFSQFRDSVLSSDKEMISKRAHSFGGALADIGANRAGKLVEELREMGRGDYLMDAVDTINELEKEIILIKNFLSNPKWMENA